MISSPNNSPSFVYEAPDGSCIFNPTFQQLCDVIMQSSSEYWQSGGNAEAFIRFAQGSAASRQTRLAHENHGLRIEFTDNAPELWIKRPEDGAFLFTWVGDNGRWIVPYDGTSCDVFVADERGGDPFKIPRACLVNVQQALEIVREFLRSSGRADSINWLSWYELPLRRELYES
jgi:hypothetical protein